MSQPLLAISDLRVAFPARSGLLLAVGGVSFTIDEGEVLGLVGESGSGKSITCRAILGLVPPPGAVIGGAMQWNGRDLHSLPQRELRQLRGKEIGMVFQDPLSALNPVFTVGHQLKEVLARRLGLPRHQLEPRAIELLDRVGIPSPRSRLKSYAHELSGGMRQRIMIALALAGEPRLLIADEPTTSLDVTIQDQILHLLLDLRREMRMSLLLVSHDMGVIAQTCDRVAVMYAGRLFESGPVNSLFDQPRHPYTEALLQAIPRIDVGRSAALRPIPGQPPNLAELPAGCPFAPRCSYVEPACTTNPIALIDVGADQSTACAVFARTAQLTHAARSAEESS